MTEPGGSRDAAPGGSPTVVPLGTPRATTPPEDAGSPPGRLHGIAMAGMALFAIVGILATLAFITVGWPGSSGRRVIAVVVFSAVGFVASAAIAVLAAARDTYPERHGRPADRARLD